jgi:hypothetical protein
MTLLSMSDQKFLTVKPTEDDHAIIANELLIPLELHGVTSYFPAREPTVQEYNECKRIEMTYPDPEWKPSDVQYSEEEARFIHNDGTLREHKRTIFACETHNEERFISELMSVVIVDGEEEEILSDHEKHIHSVT